VANDCTCGRIAIGLEVTEHRNWNPDCPKHGTGSEWWNSEEQRAKRAARAERLAELQARARKARATARQGWDRAEFTCGRCGTTVTADTEREYINLISGHKAACNAATALEG
jgi:hypothetical protein